MISKSVHLGMKGYKEIRKLMKSAFPSSEQTPMLLLHIFALKKSVNFKAFYEGTELLGILYTIENKDYCFIFYVAVNEQMRSKGIGKKIIEEVYKQKGDKIIGLHVEAMDKNAENAEQRKRRIAFYERNGILDTGYVFLDEGVLYSVLSSDIEHFDVNEYGKLLASFSFGIYRPKMIKREENTDSF